MQAEFCDNRICDYRRLRLDSRVDNEAIKARMRQRGLLQVDIARELGIDQNKVTKSLVGTRQWKIGEMDRLREILRDDLDAAQPLRSIPVIGMVAAGNWREAIQQSRDVMPAPDPRLPSRAFGLEVMGDSMDLIAEDGSQVVVDPDDKALYPDRYYVILNSDGEATFKQFKADPARLVPCSSNPIHQPIEIGGETFEVVGRVIWRSARM